MTSSASSLRLFAFVLAAGACSGLAPERGSTLIEDVRGYNDGLRWRRPPQAAVRIPPPERSDFFSERADLEEELRIAGYQIRRVRYGPRHERAVVHVEWTWHLDSRGLVHETTTRQRWEQHGKRWLMVEEHRLRGEPMPGVAEPPEEAAEAAGGSDRSRAR